REDRGSVHHPDLPSKGGARRMVTTSTPRSRVETPTGDRSRQKRHLPRPRDRRAADALAAVVPAGKTATAAIRPGAEHSSSWYRTAFASAAGQHTSRERSAARLSLAHGIARNMTVLNRLADCGRPLGASSVVIKKGGDSERGLYATGIQTCGSIWA